MNYFLFDIGNVLLNFDFNVLLHAYAEQGNGSKNPHSEVETRMYNALESGDLSSNEYIEFVNKTRGVDWQIQDLSALWEKVFTFNASGNELLAKAKSSDANVCFLSNIAQYHIDTIERKWNGLLDDVFKRFYSFEMGVRKPDPRIYEMALEQLDVPGEQCFFIDDLADNIAAARAAGIQAHQFIPETYATVTQDAHQFFGW